MIFHFNPSYGGRPLQEVSTNTVPHGARHAGRQDVSRNTVPHVARQEFLLMSLSSPDQVMSFAPQATREFLSLPIRVMPIKPYPVHVYAVVPFATAQPFELNTFFRVIPIKPYPAHVYAVVPFATAQPFELNTFFRTSIRIHPGVRWCWPCNTSPSETAHLSNQHIGPPSSPCLLIREVGMRSRTLSPARLVLQAARNFVSLHGIRSCREFPMVLWAQRPWRSSWLALKRR